MGIRVSPRKIHMKYVLIGIMALVILIFIATVIIETFFELGLTQAIERKAV